MVSLGRAAVRADHVEGVPAAPGAGIRAHLHQHAGRVLLRASLPGCAAAHALLVPGMQVLQVPDPDWQTPKPWDLGCGTVGARASSCHAGATGASLGPQLSPEPRWPHARVAIRKCSTNVRWAAMLVLTPGPACTPLMTRRLLSLQLLIPRALSSSRTVPQHTTLSDRHGSSRLPARQRTLARVMDSWLSCRVCVSSARQPKRSEDCTCTFTPAGKRRWMAASIMATSF